MLKWPVFVSVPSTAELVTRLFEVRGLPDGMFVHRVLGVAWDDPLGLIERQGKEGFIDRWLSPHAVITRFVQQFIVLMGDIMSSVTTRVGNGNR